MKQLFPFAFLLVVLLAGCSKDETPQTLEGEIGQIMANEKIPGLAAVVVKNDRVLWMQSFGYANYATLKPFTNNTPLKLSSVSKLFAFSFKGTGLSVPSVHCPDADDPYGFRCRWTCHG